MRPDGRSKTKAAGVAALAVLLLWGTPVAAQDPAALLASGRAAYEAGDFERARRELWSYLDATASLSGASRLPQAEALYYIALMEPDAAVAAQNYQTIVEEYAAASVADLAAFRLAQYDLVTGRYDESRARFDDLRRGYPFSRIQPELPLWIGRAHLAGGAVGTAIESFTDGLTRVKSMDMPVEIPASAREALAAEYAWWLASAYAESGDAGTANQYYTMLVLDYPGSPQAVEARRAMGGEPGPALADAAVSRPPVLDLPVPGSGDRAGDGVEPVAMEEEPAFEDAPAARETPDREPPPARVEEPPVREAPPAVVERPPVREDRPVVAERPPVREAPAVVVDDPAKFPSPSGSQRVWIQVGAFSSATNAADLSRRLKADGFETRVQVAIVDGQGFYRVQVGPYQQPADRARVQATRERLSALGYIPREVVDEE